MGVWQKLYKKKGASDMEQVNLIGPGEMAKILGVPISWIYQRTRKGQEAIPHIKMGKYVRFNSGDVLNFLKERGNQNV